jgi:uncharacterized protein (DUF1501 family)
MLSRRDFLKSSTLIALAPTVPAFLARTARAAKPERDGSVLVVVQLDGGNDGINTVVPFKDEGYAKHRKTLRLRAEDLVKVNDTVGLHPSLADAGKLLEAGRLAIVQGVGYPNPNRSHFESMAIWHTARPDPKKRGDVGWLGLALDGGDRPGSGVPGALFAGSGTLPVALRGRRSVTSSLTRPEDFVLHPAAKPKAGPAGPDAKNELDAFLARSALDAYATADRMAGILAAKDDGARYPATELARQFRLLARLIKANIGTRVFFARQPGYDTHSGQLGSHPALLGALGGALRAFFDDLTAAKLAERVVVLTFSEFGRTVRENDSAGTDHGTSGPVLLAGAVKPGPVGKTPSLLDLDPQYGDLRTEIDFRRVYATVLEDWLGLPSKPALAGMFERLPLFRS